MQDFNLDLKIHTFNDYFRYLAFFNKKTKPDYCGECQVLFTLIEITWNCQILAFLHISWPDFHTKCWSACCKRLEIKLFFEILILLDMVGKTKFVLFKDLAPLCKMRYSFIGTKTTGSGPLTKGNLGNWLTLLQDLLRTDLHASDIG